MPSPQSAVPKPVVPSLPQRHFTVAKANATLPLVRRIVSDVMRSFQTASDLNDQLAEGLTAQQQQFVKEQLDVQKQKLQGYVDELSDIGCQLKDPSVGLIDFIGRHQGHDVCLCWKAGETEVLHWHELADGFPGRKPIATLEED